MRRSTVLHALSAMLTASLFQVSPAAAQQAPAAPVKDERAPAAPGRFGDAVEHGFFGDLSRPAPPAINAVRRVRLPGAEPAPNPGTAAKPATEAKPADLRAVPGPAGTPPVMPAAAEAPAAAPTTAATTAADRAPTATPPAAAVPAISAPAAPPEATRADESKAAR